MEPAEARLVAVGTLSTVATRSRAFTSTSWGRVWIGLQEKMTRSIPPPRSSPWSVVRCTVGEGVSNQLQPHRQPLFGIRENGRPREMIGFTTANGDPAIYMTRRGHS